MSAGSPAERLSTPVDGVDVIGALSPSRAGDFLTCPLLYRLRTIDRLPEPPSPAAVRGTVVHKVLEDLFDLPAAGRTPEQAASMITPSWESILAAEPELATMFESSEGSTGDDIAAWLTSCRDSVARWFTLEDPTRLEPAERELYVETVLPTKLLLRGFIDRLDEAPDGRLRVVDYKGLARDTPLPTPTGWTTMGDVAVGDRLVGSDGRSTTVTAKSAIHSRPCYRIRFADGSIVTADNVHLWTVVTSHRQQQTIETISTEILHERHHELLRDGRRQSMWIDAAAALSLPDADLPIAPWLLGAWLGDGDSRSGGLTVGHQDLFDMLTLVKAHWDRGVRVRLERSAGRVIPTKLEGRCTYGHDERKAATDRHYEHCAREADHAAVAPVNLSLSTELRRLDLLHSKHIPMRYLRASYDQRLALLRGLMDTDGWWNKTRRRAGFTTTDDRLAEDVCELLRTLGVSPRHFTKPYSNRKREGRTRHVIEFTPSHFNPFALPRKASACDGAVSDLQRTLSSRRVIVEVTAVDSVPTQCISVDAPDSLYVCGTGFIPTHNTGRAPSERFQDKPLFQLKFYALVLWRARGIVPAMLQLVYLGSGHIIRYEPDESDLLATERKVEAIWRGITAAQESGDWQPKTGPLCRFCSFQELCPAYGGTPPPLPMPAVRAAAAATSRG